MKKEITKEITEKYLESPNHCPFCGSIDIEAGRLYMDDFDFKAHSVVTCIDCNAEWVDVYTLTGLEPKDDEDDE